MLTKFLTFFLDWLSTPERERLRLAGERKYRSRARHMAGVQRNLARLREIIPQTRWEANHITQKIQKREWLLWSLGRKQEISKHKIEN